MANKYEDDYDNESGSGAGLLIALGLGALAGWALTPSSPKKDEQPVQDLRLSHERLTAFQNRWKGKSDIFDDRRKTLEKYHLEKTIHSLQSDIQQAYVESLNCFLLGCDIASANMVGLSIELLLRDKTKEEKKSLHDLIDDLEKRKVISVTLSKTLHLLRQIRNVQSHTLNKLEELDLLSLFKAVGDIQKLVI